MKSKQKYLFVGAISCLLFLILSVSIIYTTSVKDFSLTILHTNDTHGIVSQEPYLKTLADSKKQNGENVLIISAGDTFHGQLIAQLSKGLTIAKIMNCTGYDYIAPGNHDFNYEVSGLKDIEAQANFKILASNVTNKSDGSNVFTPYDIKIIDGVKIGIFGLATPETLVKTSGRESITKLNFENPIENAKKIVKQLKQQGCKIIIAITHLGLYDSSDLNYKSNTLAQNVSDSSDSNYKSDYLPQNVSDIDVIVDGHSHTILQNGLYVKDTLIAQAGEHGKNIGVVNLSIKDEKLEKSAYLINSDEYTKITPDREILQIIQDENKKIEDLVNEKICDINFDLDGERQNVRTRETNLTDLVTDAILDKTQADLVLINSGTVRGSIKAGTITKGDVYKILPFTNFVVKLEKVKGSTILKAIEHGVSQYPKASGGNIQVAGIKFKFDPNKKENEKVFDVRFIKNNQELNPNAEYRLATNQFMIDGGDGYDMFIEKYNCQQYGTLENILIDYMQNLGSLEKYSKVQNRIHVQKKLKKYTIKKGDSLYKIAKKFGTTWQKLATYNAIKNPRLIFPGNVISIY